MAKADQALSLFTKCELHCYETLKTKQENLGSCRKELRKLSRRIIGGQKGLSADTLEQKETLKKELKTDITKLKVVLKKAFGKAYYKIRKNETKTKKDHMAMKKINDKKTKDDKPMTRGKPAKYMSYRST